MYESYVVHGILDLGWVFERYYAESTCGCANSLSFRRTLTSSGFWKPCCPLSIISHLTISGVIWMYVRVQYMHLASENWFLYHCQKQIVPQQKSVPASGDFTPVSPAKAICTCVHCNSICAAAAAHLPQPRPVPDPALSLHCQVSYSLRTV